MTERSNQHPTSPAQRIPKEIIILSVLAALALLVVSASPHSQKPFASSEVHFTDSSSGGLSIIPASCPSSPHYSGECSGTPPSPPSGGCSMSAYPDPMVAGQSSVLSWATGNYSYLGMTITPGNASITGIGGVNPTGSATISPTQNTTYTLSGTYSWSPWGYTITFGSFSCSRSVTVNACPVGYSLQNGQCVLVACPLGYTLQNGTCVFTGCPTGYILQGGACVRQQETPQCPSACSGNKLVNTCTGAVQQCAYGCTPGGTVCNGVPAPSITTWNVRPILVRSGSTSRVTWTGQNVASCTVRGTNHDGDGTTETGLWNTTSGDASTTPIVAQTIYTIICQGFAGSSPASVTKSTTVNIVPVESEH